ncbi:hypothetical protein D3C85_693130 [compost metagenome]
MLKLMHGVLDAPFAKPFGEGCRRAEGFAALIGSALCQGRAGARRGILHDSLRGLRNQVLFNSPSQPFQYPLHRQSKSLYFPRQDLFWASPVRFSH